LMPQDLRLEITESVLMHNAAAAEQILNEIKSIGVQLSIDDFGTGYSSLSYLHRFPFDILKIDRSFVSRMNTDKESCGIVKTIITLAQELEKAVVAEGVETDSHRDLLRRLSCPYGQGFLFSRPVEAGDAEKLLKTVSPKPFVLPHVGVIEKNNNRTEKVYAV
jgi:EAL domain-containing protein (putative c-di-GMP-specific phosphodiesterase class I)